MQWLEGRESAGSKWYHRITEPRECRSVELSKLFVDAVSPQADTVMLAVMVHTCSLLHSHPLSPPFPEDAWELSSHVPPGPPLANA